MKPYRGKETADVCVSLSATPGMGYQFETMKRHSYKMHGAWVRHKRFDQEGRISFYDRKTRLVWVVWEPHGKRKEYSAGGYRSTELIYLQQYEHDPWFRSLGKGA